MVRQRLAKQNHRLTLPVMKFDARVAAKGYYRHSSRRLQEDVAGLIANPQGVVLFSPALVVLGRAVRRTCPEPWDHLEEPQERADAWYIHFLAGDLAWARLLASTLPPLPWLCFQRGARDERLRYFQWRHLPRTPF